MTLHHGNAECARPLCMAAGFPLTSEPSPQALSIIGATATLTQNILGAGVLALPNAFSDAGLIGSATLLGMIFVLSVLSMIVLLLLANSYGDFSYKGAAQRTLGSKMSIAVEVWVLCYSLGICVSYIVLLGNFLEDIALFFKLGSWATQRLAMTIVVAFVCWPLSCARSLGVLTYTSSVGVLAIIFTSVAVVKRYADGSYTTSETNHPAMFNIESFGKCFPILVGAFGAHYNIPGLYREVAPDAGKGDKGNDQRSLRRMTTVITSSLVLSSILYGTVGTVVYLTFGSESKGDFSLNFKPDDPWLIATRVALTFALCVTFPLSMVAARSSVLKLTNWELSARTQVPVATALVGLCLFIALVAGDVSTVLAYNGSVFGTPVCYIVPMVMYLHMPRSYQTVGWRIFSVVCAAIGVIFGILGIVVVTIKLVEGQS